MPDANPDPGWHQLEPDTVLTRLDSSLQGLPEEQAAQRLQQYGYNELPSGKPIHPFMRFLRQVIPASELVPDDIVLLQSGDKVPVDLRLLKTQSLMIQEAALTGESNAVEKSRQPVAHDMALAERVCMAYAGTLVTYGQGIGIAVGTGQATEIGRINLLVGKVQGLTTPLLRQMTQFSRTLTGLVLALAAATMLFGTLVRGYAAGETFIAAVALAVATIPEGLPAIMLVNNHQRLPKNHAD